MTNLAFRRYSETNAKYKKFRKRFDKKIESGIFYKLSKRKQRSLINRLRKLYEKLLRLKYILKLATAGATMTLALTAGHASAQDLKTENFLKKKFKTGQSKIKGFESDLFIQVSGTDNPFGGSNPFDGQNVSQGDRTNFVDIDNDGDLDAFSVNNISYNFSINYYKNIGNNNRANLEKQTGSSSPVSGWEFGEKRPNLSFVDIDNDGDFDVFNNNNNSFEIQYYKNIGDAENPEFEEQTGSNNPLDGFSPMNMERLSFADIDNDDDLDVFIGTFNNAPYLYRNTGTSTNPSFTPEDASGLFDNTISLGQSFVLADIDGDNDLDMLYNGYDYYENQGTEAVPYFVAQTGANNPVDGISQVHEKLISLIDIDGDSDLDLFFGEEQLIFFYENEGNINTPEFVNKNGGLPDSYIAFPDFTDIDNDGDYDMFAAYTDSEQEVTKIRFFKNIGTAESPEYEQQADSENPMSDYIFPNNILTQESVDLDNDGDYDIVVGKTDYNNSEIEYFKNIGTAENPEFELQTGANNPFSNITCYFAFNTFVDIDNDGDFDLFRGSTYSDGTLLFYRNTGSVSAPVFAEETSPISLPDNIFISFPEFVDIDDDGDYDFFSGVMDYDAYTWSVKHYINNGSPESPDFVEQTGDDNPLAVEMDVSFPRFVDIDNDSDFDCFVGTYAGQLLYFRNKTVETGINIQDENNLQLYPNPTDGIVIFSHEKFNNESIKVELIDMLGKKVSNFRLVEYNKIDLSNLNAGIYFIKISNNSVSKTSKVIVK